jgi:hypothetical protein
MQREEGQFDFLVLQIAIERRTDIDHDSVITSAAQ